MKNINVRTNKIVSTILLAGLMVILIACEQEGVTPELNAAPGGGTISTYKAYALDSKSTDNVYGRVVFWKDNAKHTLVQISLYNTEDEEVYPTGIYVGTADAGSTTPLLPLYSIDGTTGEFGTSKFYVINDNDFYDNLTGLDAYVRILSGTDLVASGNVGSNAEPVATGE